jgi:hypothetical protein
MLISLKNTFIQMFVETLLTLFRKLDHFGTNAMKYVLI